MKTSILHQHQFLQSKLLELVEISNLVEQKDRFFILKFNQWLVECEAKLKELRIAEASHFSVYKTELFNVKNTKVRNKQKLLLSKSIEKMKQAQQSLYQLFLPMDQKITQAEEIIENILVLIESTEEFRKLKDPNFALYVQNVWNFILKQEAFQNHANQLKVLISFTDIRLILGQKLEL